MVIDIMRHSMINTKNNKMNIIIIRIKVNLTILQELIFLNYYFLKIKNKFCLLKKGFYKS
jgi:hypothetical protein